MIRVGDEILVVHDEELAGRTGKVDEIFLLPGDYDCLVYLDGDPDDLATCFTFDELAIIADPERLNVHAEV